MSNNMSINQSNNLTWSTISRRNAPPYEVNGLSRKPNDSSPAPVNIFFKALFLDLLHTSSDKQEKKLEIIQSPVDGFAKLDMFINEDSNSNYSSTVKTEQVVKIKFSIDTKKKALRDTGETTLRKLRVKLEIKIAEAEIFSAIIQKGTHKTSSSDRLPLGQVNPYIKKEIPTPLPSIPMPSPQTHNAFQPQRMVSFHSSFTIFVNQTVYPPLMPQQQLDRSLQALSASLAPWNTHDRMSQTVSLERHQELDRSLQALSAPLAPWNAQGRNNQTVSLQPQEELGGFESEDMEMLIDSTPSLPQQDAALPQLPV